MADVHPIVEEAERASLTKELVEGEGAWGSQSGVSMTSIPIGIPKFYLDGRESGVSIAASSTYSDYAPDVPPPTREEPLKTFQQRMQQQDADDGQEDLSTQEQTAVERQEARGMNDYYPPPGSHAGSSDRGESPSDVPVRQASMGRRRRPTLTTVKSGDRMRSSSTASHDASAVLPSQQEKAEEADIPMPTRQSEGDAGSGADRPATHVEQSLTAPPPPPVHPEDMPSSNAKSLEASPKSTGNAKASAPEDSPKSSVRAVNSKESLNTAKPGHKLRGRSPLAKTDNHDDHGPLDKEILVEDPEKDGRLGIIRQDSDTLMSPTTGLSGARAGKRKPPRLDVDKIKEEEKRGSLSSLSDLIKRATKVASNLDRGRTASRLGMEAWLGPGNGKGPGNSNNNSSGEIEKYRRSAGSLSDILASFPPPVVSTPTGGRENRSLANWSSRRSSRPLPSDSDGASQIRSRKQRRCCGIPLWLFITLLLLLLALVTAAAVIPVVLIVIPNQKDKSAPSAQSDLVANQAATSNKCAAKVTCENGGQAFPTAEDTCRCLCVNSFTGPTCSSRSTAGCSSIAVSGLQANATIGDAIPRLLALADSDYDMKLDAQTLLGLFNEADLNCAAENALVSFNGKAQKHRRMPAPQATQTDADQPAEATRNGIVFDSSPSPSQTSASTAPLATSSSSASSSSPTSSSKTIDVDFARAAVLYILQSSSSLQDAESAQKALQENLSDKIGGIVDVGQYNVDLDAKVVTKA